MAEYNFKKITVVPTGKELIDIIFSRTPTQVHEGYVISRLPQSYIQKIKFTQTNYHEKLSTIIDEFPSLDDVHPFHADLLQVLCKKDHYKFALGQINTARNLIGKISEDSIRVSSDANRCKPDLYGASLDRCKSLKFAALGRICTVINRISRSLAYLEQIRQHMTTLPSIDPNTRTILICGYPNVGKSSFINKITSADVDVQPYAFTTKSLFVGHTDYKNLRYQVIDTPGILDRPFEDRDITEICSLTALAHLRAAVLFFLDISGSCGYNIAQQAALFHSIKSLFMNKPLIIVCNKTDLQPLDGISEEDKKLVEEMKSEALKTVIGQADESGVLLTMSTLTEEGVIAVRNVACERLLNQKVELKMKSKKKNDRFHVVMPKPTAVNHKEQQVTAAKKRKRDLEEENTSARVYSASVKKHYLLDDEEWKENYMPEILNEKNVYDFIINPDILHRLEKLEKEEGLDEDHDFEMDAAELTCF